MGLTLRKTIPQNKKTKKNKKNKKINKSQSGFKTLNCNSAKLSLTNNKQKETCYDDSQLIFLKTLWNIKNPEERISNSVSSNQIWAILKAKYKNKCSDEACWIDELTTQTQNTKHLKNSFAPNAPNEWDKNPNTWLTDSDIEKVMKQYEKAYKCFYFVGCSPIDFDLEIKDIDSKENPEDDCVCEKLCKFSVKECIDWGKNKIGVIFNTDPHDKSGQHWISLFINIKKGQIFFFDSVGSKIPDEIMVLVDRIIKQGLNQNPPIHFKFDQNHPIEHQYSDTECGMYSLYFIVHMLQDKLTARYLKTHILSDKYIEKYRKKWFN